MGYAQLLQVRRAIVYAAGFINAVPCFEDGPAEDNIDWEGDCSACVLKTPRGDA